MDTHTLSSFYVRVSQARLAAQSGIPGDDCDEDGSAEDARDCRAGASDAGAGASSGVGSAGSGSASMGAAGGSASAGGLSGAVAAPCPVPKAPCVACNTPCELQCSRCHFAHYCSKACQRSDRARHQHACREWWASIPSEAPACANCHRAASMCCARCRAVSYCSPECQAEHAAEHHETCPPEPDTSASMPPPVAEEPDDPVGSADDWVRSTAFC